MGCSQSEIKVKENKPMNYRQDDQIKSKENEPIKNRENEPIKKGEVEPIKNRENEPIKNRENDPIKNREVEQIRTREVEPLKKGNDEQIKNEENIKINHMIEIEKDLRSGKFEKIEYAPGKRVFVPRNREDVIRIEKDKEFILSLDKQLEECLELSNKKYFEDTIIYCKTLVTFESIDNIVYEIIVVKTLKQEGLPYKSLFRFKPSTVIASKERPFINSVCKVNIFGGNGLGLKTDKIRCNIYFNSEDLFYLIPLVQEPDEPFVVYYFETRVKKEYLMGNKNLFMVPFVKNRIDNPNCKCELYFNCLNFRFSGANQELKNEITKENDYFKIIPEEDNKFIFRKTNEGFKINPTVSAFQNSFYTPDEVNIIREIVNKINLKLGLKVIAVKETYTIKEKIVTVELIKTFMHLREENTVQFAAHTNLLEEYKNIKLLKLESNNDKARQNLNYLKQDRFTMNYYMKFGEVFATVKAVYEFTISKSEENKDIIKIDLDEYSEGALYICKVNYDKSEYDSVTLKRDKDGKFSKDNYYYEEFSKNKRINSTFNEIYLNKIKK